MTPGELNEVMQDRLDAAIELCQSWLYAGRCANASDEQLMRDELARELLAILED